MNSTTYFFSKLLIDQTVMIDIAKTGSLNVKPNFVVDYIPLHARISVLMLMKRMMMMMMMMMKVEIE